METIAESNPKVIKEVAPQSQVESKASATKPTFSNKQWEVILVNAASLILAEMKAGEAVAPKKAISTKWVPAASHPESGVKESNDVAQADPFPEVVPSPVLFHRDREGRMKSFWTFLAALLHRSSQKLFPRSRTQHRMFQPQLRCRY